MVKVSCPEAVGNDLLATQWHYVLKSFGIDLSDFSTTPSDEFPIILIQPVDGVFVSGEVSLADFQHPDDCTYMFGASDGQLEPALHTFAAKVYIPSVPSWALYASQAGAIVLYDRYVKRGGFG